MKVLVDTQIFLWAITDDPRLALSHRRVFEDPASELYFSFGSVWEILIKIGLGKLQLPKPTSPYLERQLAQNSLRPLTLRWAHLAELEILPPVHRDPFDRIIAAQARAEGMALLTADRTFDAYGVTLA